MTDQKGPLPAYLRLARDSLQQAAQGEMMLTLEDIERRARARGWAVRALPPEVTGMGPRLLVGWAGGFAIWGPGPTGLETLEADIGPEDRAYLDGTSSCAEATP